MAYATIEVEQDGGLAWLTLNRPDELNALNGQLVDDLCDYFDGLRSDTTTRVVALRGAGRAFCAGIDLKDPPTSDKPGARGTLDHHGYPRGRSVPGRGARDGTR